MPAKKQFKRSRISSRDALKHLESLKKGSQEEKIRQTASRFGVDPRRIAGLVAMEWARENFPGLFQRRARKPKFSEEELLQALRRHRTFTATADALDTTPLTVKALAVRYGFNRSEDLRTREIIWTLGSPGTLGRTRS
jgi:hypothetical protein